MRKKKIIALYPGTFDPITFGHLDVLNRASEIFDKVIITVSFNPNKKTMFTVDERVEMILESVKNKKNIEVESFHGILMDFAKKKNAPVIVRGLRAISDFEFEFQMALMNRKLAQNITTVFLMPHEKYTYLNSSIVRELATLKGDFTSLVPKNVAKKLQKKFK